MIYRNREIDEWEKMKGKPNPDYLLVGRLKSAEDVCQEMVFALRESGRQDILKKNPMVLDIGGGDAAFADYLEKKRQIKCVSLDIQKYAKKNEAARVTADMYQLPFADKSFDMIVSHGTLDVNVYAHDFVKMAPELARVLKEHGLFYDNLGFVGVKNDDLDEIRKYFKLIGESDVEDESDPYYSRPVWEKI